MVALMNTFEMLTNTTDIFTSAQWINTYHHRRCYAIKDGVIFVIQNEHGVTIKNLHIGGGGEDTYLIEEPGVYSLAINGSDTWKIWLTPDTQ